MAQTVSLPLALAALRVLDGHVRTRGVVGPTADKEIYRPVLRDMADLGLVMREDVRVRRDGNAIGERMLQSFRVA
jgi:alpha-aminoadipic semialdehyde synthase